MPLVAFTPYVAALGVLATGLLAWRRRWGSAAMAGVAAVSLAVVVVPRAIGKEGEGGVPLRVMTANMKLGEGDPDALVEIVRSEEVDVLSVQELTSGLAQELEAAGLAGELPHKALAAAPFSSGGGIFSRLPIARLSGLPSSLADPLPGVRLRVPGAAQEVELYDFHPPAPVDGAAVAEWSSDLRTVPEAAARGPLTVVAGDFNATLDHSELRNVLGRGYRDAADDSGVGLQPTWPTGRVFPPQVAVDHVIVDERAQVGEASIRDLAGSDHRAVVAEVLLPAR